MDYAAVAEVAAPAGFRVRGGFHPAPEDGVPGAAADGTETLILLGNVGPAMWRAFSASPARPAAHAAQSDNRAREAPPDSSFLAHARPGGLDRWTRATVAAFAERWPARAFFPFDRPFLPFQRWAAKAENLSASPLGILIHPDYGLWHAYRAALLFARRIALPAADTRPSPCASCADKPCLSACPVGAVETGRYDVPACTTHLAGPRGDECLSGGCLARRACPVGRAYVYEPAQSRFHIEAFLRANRAKDV